MFIVKSPHYGPPTPAFLEAAHKMADREIKAGRMLDSGGLMPLARRGAHRRRQAQRGRPLRRSQGGDRRLRDLRTAGKEEALASVKEFMQLHKDLMPDWEGTCEIRACAPGMS
ncbi:MAG: hypothetical protein WBF47_08650 [Xanthobacteraceae bacterium]